MGQDAKMALFQPRGRRKKLVLFTALDVVTLVVLGVALVLLDMALRQLISPEMADRAREFMVLSWLTVFILQLINNVLRER